MIRIDLIECPFALALGMDGELKQVGSDLIGALCTYPVVGGVPDLRMPSNRGPTSYDALLPGWGAPTVENPANVIATYGLTPQMIRDKVVCVAGVGVGRELVTIQTFGPREIHAVDYSNHIQAVAARLAGPHFYQADICNMPFKSGIFDLIISAGVIQHSRSPELAFRSMARCLKADGTLTLGNYYPQGLHNRRVTIHRNRLMLHRMPVEKAKRYLRYNAWAYYVLVKTGLWRLHRRYQLPWVLEYSNTPGQSLEFYYENAEDYYLPAYRHTLSEAEISDFGAQLGMTAERTPKGHKFRK
jgi:SAM-dependent methyltransferase